MSFLFCNSNQYFNILFTFFSSIMEPESNPWAVESIMAFNYFVCPECNFQARTPPSFEKHAIENHPRAKKLFDPEESIKADADNVVEELLKSMQGAIQGTSTMQTEESQVKEEEPENYYFDINIGDDYGDEDVEPQQSEVQLQPKETEDKSFFLGNSMNMKKNIFHLIAFD